MVYSETVRAMEVFMKRSRNLLQAKRINTPLLMNAILHSQNGAASEKWSDLLRNIGHRQPLGGPAKRVRTGLRKPH